MIVRELPIDRRSTKAPPPDVLLARLRLLVLGLFMVAAFGILIYRMYGMQVVNNETAVAAANRNSTITITTPALRGLIYDREGIPLVLNAPAYQISVVPEQLPFYARTRNSPEFVQQTLERNAIYNRLADLLALAPQYVRDDPLNVAPSISQTDRAFITAGEIYTRVWNAERAGAFAAPIVIAENVPRELALIIQEQAINMPGVTVEIVGSRIYPNKNLTGAFMGYVNKIPAELEKRYLDRGYSRTDRVGVSGVELVVEDELRGQKGTTLRQRDASGELGKIIGDPVLARDGNSVRLTLDLRLQRIISETMLEAMAIRESPRAAAVAINPKTGEVLGMWGWPTFDNNIFIRGITQKELDAFRDDIHKPLLNKATQDRVPPGSIFKIVTTAALLEEGIANEFTRIRDPGIFGLENKLFPNDPTKEQKFYCWLRTGHGIVGIRDAFRQSCDTFYYKLVGGYDKDGISQNNLDRRLGMDRLAKWMQNFGVAITPTIEVAASPGFAPTPRWKRETFGEVWTTGDDYNASIGQGFVLATPLEMANMAAVVANGGTLYEPQVVKEVIDVNGAVIKPYEPKVLKSDFMRPSTIRLLQDTMVEVLGPAGTAPQSAIPGFTYAGKTGTAEFCDDIAQKLNICYAGIKEQPTHAWFVSYAPAKDPQIAMAVYVWNGGQGSGVAAPITQRIYNKYFNLGMDEKKLAPIQKGKSSSE